MKRIIWLILLTPVLLFPGCSQSRTSAAVTGLTFDRGCGSTWGNQLYISLTQTRITTLRYIPEGSSELQILEDLPITPRQWQSITQALEQLTLKKEKTTLSGKQDGGDYRCLTLTYGKKSVTYRWPDNGAILETLLEQLVQEVTQ